MRKRAVPIVETRPSRCSRSPRNLDAAGGPPASRQTNPRSNVQTVKVSYTIVSDTVTPNLKARLSRVRNPKPALRRMGQGLLNWTHRAAPEATMREGLAAALERGTAVRRAR